MIQSIRLKVVTAPELVSQAASELRGSEKARWLAAAAVPMPYADNVPTAYDSNLCGSAGDSPASRNAQFVRNMERRVKLWTLYAPAYKIPGVRLSELAARPKPCVAHREEAMAKMESMISWASDACSAKFFDEEGQLMAAYFAKRIVHPVIRRPPGPLTENLPNYAPGPDAASQLRRTAADVEQAEKESLKVHHEGIPPDVLQEAHYATQVLHYNLHPHRNPRDGRHDKSDSMVQYQKDSSSEDNPEDDVKLFIHNQTVYVHGSNSIVSERTGISHLVHVWPEQGKKEPKNFHPSRDLIRTCSSSQSLAWYYPKTERLAKLLAIMFKASFPTEYVRYEAAFKAGRWVREDPGPWLGRVHVWKLQVIAHRDGLDAGPTAIFNMGNYEGGEAYLTDLELKLQYSPGDVLIFLAADLYHVIGPWHIPQDAKVSAEGLTPGRVGNVFFSPASSLTFLKDRGEGWFKDTLAGTLPSSHK